MARGGRNVPGLQQRFALKGKLLVHYWKGKVVVQKWPKPYGPARSAAQQATQDAFKKIQRAVKYALPEQTIAAMELTAKTGMYPRDLMMQAMTGTNILLAYDEPGAQQMIGDGLQKFTAVGGETSIDLQNIPPGYSALLINFNGRTLRAATQDPLLAVLNGDVGSNYDREAWNRFGQADGYGVTPAQIGTFSGNTAPTSYAASGTILFPNYANTSFFKLYFGNTDLEEFHSAGGLYRTNFTGAWRKTDAISRITLTTTGGIVRGSTVTLYGLF